MGFKLGNQLTVLICTLIRVVILVLLTVNHILVRYAVVLRVIHQLKLDRLVNMLATTARVRIADPTLDFLLSGANRQELWFRNRGAITRREHPRLLPIILLQDLKRHRVRQVIEQLDFILAFRLKLLHLLLIALRLGRASPIVPPLAAMHRLLIRISVNDIQRAEERVVLCMILHFDIKLHFIIASLFVAGQHVLPVLALFSFCLDEFGVVAGTQA